MAIYFINPVDKYVITTNYKVWFSTLTAHGNLLRSNSSGMAGYKHYLFARNPYERLESFYRDKLIDSPANAVFSPDFKWQDCQKIFLDKSGKRNGCSFEEQREYLQSISFQEFIELLSDICYLDRHLLPQTIAIKKHPDVVLNMEFDRILKVEEQECIEFIKDELKIDTSIRRNYTKGLKVDLIWNSNMRSIVNQVYRDDFVLLGYPMMT